MVSKDPSRALQTSLTLSPHLEQRHRGLPCFPSTPALAAQQVLPINHCSLLLWPPLFLQSSNQRQRATSHRSQLRERWTLFAIPALESETGIAWGNGNPMV